MPRKLTIAVADEVYRRLQQRVQRGPSSRFIEHLLRPRVVEGDQLEAAYREMAADQEREREALGWIGESPDDALDSDRSRSNRS